MGDVADMMDDGTLCSSCGVFLSTEPMGFPVECSECRADTTRDEKARRKANNIEHAARQKKVKCPQCGKRVKEVGLPYHIKAVHDADKA